MLPYTDMLEFCELKDGEKKYLIKNTKIFGGK